MEVSLCLEGKIACVATCAAIIVAAFMFKLFCCSIRNLRSSISTSTDCFSVSANSPSRREDGLLDSDLENLISSLEEKVHENENWQNVIEKKKNNLYYSAKCCKVEGAPLKYMSCTIFDNCSTELLRDFFMDNEYRKLWDKTIVSHEQLQMDGPTGIEIGRTVKKFPLLSPREYVLSWKLWEGKDNTSYCVIKECEHPSVLRQKKYVRVEFFRSGWRIMKGPERGGCEIKMVHQEDGGMNGEMARLAFSRGVWGYICKMEAALRSYTSFRDSHPPSELSAVHFLCKVPALFEEPPREDSTTTFREDDATVNGDCPMLVEAEDGDVSPTISRKKLIADGLLLLGGVMCVSRVNSSLCTAVALAYMSAKLALHGSRSGRQKPR